MFFGIVLLENYWVMYDNYLILWVCLFYVICNYYYVILLLCVWEFWGGNIGIRGSWNGV